MKIIGFMILIIVIMNSILIPKYLNRINPKMSKLKVVVFSGMLIFLIEVTFKIIQDFNYLIKGSFFNYQYIFLGISFITIISMVISTISINEIRKKKKHIPK